MPAGQLRLDIDGKQLRTPGNVLFLDQVSGRQHFRLEKLHDGQIVFSHSCPTRRTLDAITHVQAFPPTSVVAVDFKWTLTETSLSVWPSDTPQLKLTVSGILSNRQFNVQQNGNLFQSGDFGTQVFEMHVVENGREAFAKTAIELWTKTTEVNNSLLSITAPAPEKALAGVVISRLVTGFEVYCKRRFYELHQEGVMAHTGPLIDEFNLRNRIDCHRKKATARDIKGFESGDLRIVSLGIEQKLVNFQNYQDAARAYASAYRIRFDKLPAIDPHITTVTSCIKFRHRFTHSKPDTILFSDAENHRKHVELSTPLAHEKQISFDAFIRTLHAATTALKCG